MPSSAAHWVSHAAETRMFLFLNLHSEPRCPSCPALPLGLTGRGLLCRWLWMASMQGNPARSCWESLVSVPFSVLPALRGEGKQEW